MEHCRFILIIKSTFYALHKTFILHTHKIQCTFLSYISNTTTDLWPFLTTKTSNSLQLLIIYNTWNPIKDNFVASYTYSSLFQCISQLYKTWIHCRYMSTRKYVLLCKYKDNENLKTLFWCIYLSNLGKSP